MLSEEDQARREQAIAASQSNVKRFLECASPAAIEAEDRLARSLRTENASPKAKFGKVLQVVDALASEMARFTPCKAGCSACCRMNVTISTFEAEKLAKVSGRAMVRLQQSVAHAQDRFSAVPCPFLLGEQCSVYDDRPLVCRKHVTFDVDSYWCQPERAYELGMGMVRFSEVDAAYDELVQSVRGCVLADIRDFFPA